MTNLPRISA